MIRTRGVILIHLRDFETGYYYTCIRSCNSCCLISGFCSSSQRIPTWWSAQIGVFIDVKTYEYSRFPSTSKRRHNNHDPGLQLQHYVKSIRG